MELNFKTMAIVGVFALEFCAIDTMFSLAMRYCTNKYHTVKHKAEFVKNKKPEKEKIIGFRVEN